ncbi:ankyrin repeat domain-containing protein 61-like [Asterias amurensis]|uniref:ankyrin repeat domain-containing protein 61-like n=1 Tax=Asterias amurensis TaxID=7602 RepID=UPI003AB24AFF
MELCLTTADELVELINTDGSSLQLDKILESCTNPSEQIGPLLLTALHHAVHKRRQDYVECFVKHHVDVNVQDYCGYTPIHLAAKHDQVEILQQLLRPECKADTQKQDAVGYTPLSHALQEGNHTCAEVLLQNGADPNFYHKHIGSELHRVPSEFPKCVEVLLKYGADPEVTTPKGFTVLHSAVEEGNLNFVKILLELGCDINAWTSPRTGRNRRNALQLAIIGNEIDVAKCLLSNSADANCRDQQGNTPLHHSAAHGSVDIIQLLLDYGGNIHAKNDRLFEPFHRACSAGRDPAILTFLIKNGADMDALNITNDTPLHCLFLHYQYVQWTTDEAADCERYDRECRQGILVFVNNGGRFTITTEKEDFRSVLKILPLLIGLPKTASVIQESADQINISDVKDPVFITVEEPLRSQLLYASNNPRSLRQITRKVIRGLIDTKHCEEAVRKIHIPALMQNYLLFLWED